MSDHTLIRSLYRNAIQVASLDLASKQAIVWDDRYEGANDLKRAADQGRIAGKALAGQLDSTLSKLPGHRG